MSWRNQLSSRWRTLPSAWTGAAAPVRPDFSAHDAFSEHLRMHDATDTGTDEGCRSAHITAPSRTPVALPGDPVRGAARADFDLMFAACSKRLRGHIRYQYSSSEPHGDPIRLDHAPRWPCSASSYQRLFGGSAQVDHIVLPRAHLASGQLNRRPTAHRNLPQPGRKLQPGFRECNLATVARPAISILQTLRKRLRCEA